MPQTQISKITGERVGFEGVLLIAFLGAILYIPALIAFPLAASLLKKGALITIIDDFITTLTMIWNNYNYLKINL